MKPSVFPGTDIIKRGSIYIVYLQLFTHNTHNWPLQKDYYTKRPAKKIYDLTTGQLIWTIRIILKQLLYHLVSLLCKKLVHPDHFQQLEFGIGLSHVFAIDQLWLMILTICKKSKRLICKKSKRLICKRVKC